jgi:hypothetical protein
MIDLSQEGSSAIRNPKETVHLSQSSVVLLIDAQSLVTMSKSNNVKKIDLYIHIRWLLVCQCPDRVD